MAITSLDYTFPDSIKLGTLKYHLKILESFGCIHIYKDSKYTRYFTNVRKEKEQKVISVLKKDTSKEILLFLIQNQGASISEVANAIGLSGATVSWHMKNLENDGIINIVK